MTNLFFKHINQYTKINEHEFQEILTFFNLFSIQKKEMIIKAGHKCNFNFFILNGCIQMFFINDKGIERTVRFAIENKWLTDYLAYKNKTKTNFYIQAVENTQILAITYEKQEKLLTLYPKLEKYFRNVYETSYGKSLLMMRYLYSFSKEDIYFHFIQETPELAQRLPQNLIASFLGLTPEYLSKIKNKKRS